MGWGNVSLVFESANPDASDLLTVKPDGKIIATLLYDEEEAPSVKPCSVDILGISFGRRSVCSSSRVKSVCSVNRWLMRRMP